MTQLPKVLDSSPIVTHYHCLHQEDKKVTCAILLLEFRQDAHLPP